MNERARLDFHSNQIKSTPIYAILGEPQSKGRSNIEVAKALLEGGIKVLQYRDKTKSTRQKYEECLQIRELTRSYGATFIVNDSIEVALACDADGIHVGQKDMPLSIVRKLVPAHMVIGLSINRAEQWEIAKTEGIAHYIGIGPVFPTQTKLDTEPQITAALEAMAIAGDEKLPAVAISGIHEGNLGELSKRGFKRFAMVSELVGADDIVSHTRHIIDYTDSLSAHG